MDLFFINLGGTAGFLQVLSLNFLGDRAFLFGEDVL